MADPKIQVSFRVPSETQRHLQRRAEETGQSQTALAERYLEEGLRGDEHPLVRMRDGEAGRRASLVGSRLDVWQVIDAVRQNGGSAEQAARHLELPVEKVRAALRYYGEYADEVDAWAARVAAIVERELASWERAHERLV